MLDLHALDIRHGDRAEAVRVTLSEHIRSGALAPGARLPATRQLAAQLGVTRTDVLTAYAHLTDGGLIEGRGRLGTYVSCAPPDAAVSPGPAAQPADIALLDRLPHTHPLDGGEFGHLNWRIGGAAARLLDLAAWRQACREVGRHGPPPGWGDARGAPPLRAALLDYLRQVLALPVAPEQIVITRGSDLPPSAVPTEWRKSRLKVN